MAELGAVLGGRYRLDQVLGQGGMATIFRATDAKLGREVAVKVLRPEFGSDPEFVARFTDEARAAASLNHPNIVAVYDFGTDPAGPYIVMEQVAGGDLSVALGEHGALPPTAVARTGQQVADALAAAHARGLIHRDIKPGNILLSPDGRVQVADFGIAQAAVSSPLTSTGLTLGSVLYFSPEQARGDSATAASDVYALGLVLYELLTGRRAFAGDSPAAVAVARLSGGVPSPMAVRPDTPPPLDAVVRWCLAIDPAARPSAAELSTALARFIADPSGAAYGAPLGPMAPAGLAAAAGVPGATGGQAGPPPQPGAAADAERSGAGPWGWLAAAFGLVVIVASGILLFLLFSGIGEATPTPSPEPSATPPLVRTPDFVGRTEADALRAASRRGLVLETEYVESEARPGRVVDQLPDPGVPVPAGITVQVMVATRAETVVVPDVQGLREDDALAQLAAAGLQAGRRGTADDRLPRGFVVATDPRAGVSMTRDSVVDYVVSTGRRSWSPAADGSQPAAGTAGPSPRPDASARTLPVRPGTDSPDPWATSAPSSAGPVGVTPSPVGVTPSPLDTATGQATPASPTPSQGGPASPAAPSPVASAGPSALVPTNGPSATALPSGGPSSSGGVLPSPFPPGDLVLIGDYRCLDLATARSHIEAKGLVVGDTIPSSPAPGDDWLVHAQMPEAGDSVAVGSNVGLMLAGPMEACPGG
jgi:hypothetical protein